MILPAMKRTQFTVSFDGTAVRSGLMDVRDLAPALLSLGELIQEANRTLNGETAKVSVKVRSNFKKGSFEVDLILIQTLIEQAKVMLLSQQVTDAKAILENLFFFGGIPVAAGGSLFALYKWLKGRKPKENQITIIENNVTINIDGDVYKTSRKAYELFNSPSIKRATAKAMAPLSSDGIEKVEFRRGKNETETVTKDDYEYFPKDDFLVPSTAPNELSSTREVILEIVRLSFKEKQKWGFYDGSSPINAAIGDKEFLEDIESGNEAFSAGDQLHVQLHTRGWREPDGKLKAENTILKVVKHIKKTDPPKLIE